jgi:copper homeostasis protein
MSFKLEVIAFNIESCITIQNCGAHRIELCANPFEGGTTPSAGFIKAARETVSIDLFPIIRPRGGDFLYTSDEYAIMEHDIRLCKEIGCNGVVIGLLLPNGKIDKERTRRLVDLAYPLDVTFHRAFDRVANKEQALEDVIDCGCKRILTSGLRPTVSEGKVEIKSLVEQAKGRIIIMPGSGVRASNITNIAEYTGAIEFHTSARIEKESTMQFVPKAMQEVLNYHVADEKEIKECLDTLQHHFTQSDLRN